jgi:hypothetical protein
MEPSCYRQHTDRAVATDSRFGHMMAIALNPLANNKEGLIRCITSREGDVAVAGYVDRSALYSVRSSTPGKFIIRDEVRIANMEQIFEQICGVNSECIGLEDPDIYIDEVTGLIHVYFTMPFRNVFTKAMVVHLGHAVGKSLDTLVMTMPVLMSDEKSHFQSAKELSIAPLNKNGVRLNLIESGQHEADANYSVVKVAIAKDMGGPWEFGDVVFHPKNAGIPWISGHASPGPFLTRSFIDVGEGKLLGIMNGREANMKVENKTVYGIFSVGLFIYDYEVGKIDWVSPEPLIRDTEARTITFASQFVDTNNGEGVLYAHVDDSFVRGYTLNADALKKLVITQTLPAYLSAKEEKVVY